MAEPFIERPTEVYYAYLSRGGGIREDIGFKEGRMAMALEVITTRKSLAAVGMLSAGMISVLETLLADQGLLDEAEELYGELDEWRKVKLRAVSDEDPSADATPSRSRRGRLGTPSLRPRDRKSPPSS